MLLINKTVNIQHRKGQTLKRIWLEGKRLQRHVKIGTGMKFRESINGFQVIFTNSSPDRVVSKRKTKSGDVPLIEINETNSTFLQNIDEKDVLRIAVSDSGIKVTVNQATVDKRVHERERRLLNKLANKEVLEVGSCFCGGGSFDYMGARGFKKAGLATVVRLAIDFDEHAIENFANNVSHVFDERSILIQSDISHLTFNENTPALDILKITAPCTDSSKAAKAKKKNTGETDKTAHLVYYYSQLLDKSNPSYILMENVTTFCNEASFLVFQGLLNVWGYKTQIRIIDSHEEGFSLEKRKRMYLVAESQGLEGTFDIQDVTSLQSVPRTLSEVMDDVPHDHSSWSAKTGLLNKQSRDISAKKGFRMQVFSGAENYISTLRAQYQKSGSCDPLFAHPDPNVKMYRIANKNEHARFKQIDTSFVDGLTEGQAHHILGNGLIGTISEALCYFLGKAISQLQYIEITQSRAKAA